MAAATLSPAQRPLPPSPLTDAENPELSTLPDPRSRTSTPILGSEGFAHPDLNSEVTTLSNKLISAINYQTYLDDTLSATRAELDKARGQIKTLEDRNATQREMLAGDVWIRKTAVEEEKKKMLAKLASEKAHSEEVEKEKKKIELELENLTTALFEEANKMVISAKEESRKEQDVVNKKNDQLRAQLADTEALLKSQQEQLAQLKEVMEHMAEERDEQHATIITAPSSPGLNNSESREDNSSNVDGIAIPSSAHDPVAPTHPMNLPNLLQPILRTDLASYEDFTTLARLTRKHAANRNSSGSLIHNSKLGAAIGGSTSSAHVSSGSTSSLPSSANTAATANSPQTPNTPGSFVSAASTDQTIPPPTLKETKFYKRVLTEDVEPTLRLDAAPGLSWLARRSVLSAMTDGTIVVEPIPANAPYAAFIKPQYYACSLCGDVRKEERYLRTYRFRTSESETAQRYPLCKYCLDRVRSTCDFLSFLRILRDGHWRTDKEDTEKAAWEESIRLREQMFWARLGGGVVPAGHPALINSENSPRPSQELWPRVAPSETKPTELEEPRGAAQVESSIGDEAAPSADSPTKDDAAPPPSPSPSNRNSTQSQNPAIETGVEPTKNEAQRLSLTIPKDEA